MKSSPVQILNGAATGNVTGPAIDVNQIISSSMQVVTGDVAVAGTVKIQFSNDNPNGDYRAHFVPTNWSDIPSATSTVAAGIGPAILLNVMAYGYIRAVFTRSAGTTTIQVNSTLISP